MNKELFEKANLILQKYNMELNRKGITCTLSKRDFRTNPGNLFDGHRVLDSVFHKATEKREEKLYKNKQNKYFTLVLTFSPSDKSKKVNSPKSYAFITKSVARVSRGFAPKERNYNEAKILNRIEKCILKFLRKAENKPPEKICESDFLDNLRYLSLEQYSYKKTVFGKDRDSIQLSVILIFSLILIVASAIIFLT